MRWGLLMMSGVFLLSSCSSNEAAWSSAPQRWQDITIRIETQPTPLRRGMNEFLLIADHQQRGFINNLMVDVRTENSAWKQAIPDGALGVFRRALPVGNVQREHLFVRLSRDGQHGEMTFPLAPKKP